jgi:hypothetical protein
MEQRSTILRLGPAAFAAICAALAACHETPPPVASPPPSPAATEPSPVVTHATVRDTPAPAERGELDEATLVAVDLALAKAERAELGTLYGPRHPEVQAVESRIAALGERAAALAEAGATVDAEAAAQRLMAAQVELLEAVADAEALYGPEHPKLRGLRARSEALEAELTAQRAAAGLLDEPASAARVVSHCDAGERLLADDPLVGRTFANASMSLPDGLAMASESALGDGPYTLVVAPRGDALLILLDELVSEEPWVYRIVRVVELARPCSGFMVESGTCDLDGRPAPDVFAYMDELYECGGHGRSTPARAWRLEGDRIVPLDPARVTCGSESCEVDPPLD